MIKLIVIDVDGTLVNQNKIITPETKAALLKIQQSKVKLVIASGRPTSGLIRFAEELELDKYNGYYIAYNGAKVISAADMHTLFEKPIENKLVEKLLKHLGRFDVKIMIPSEGYMCVNHVDGFIEFDNKKIDIFKYEANEANLILKNYSFSDLSDIKVNKILTAANPLYLKENYYLMKEPFKDCLSCMFTAKFYFEFTAKDLDKGKAIENIIMPLGYTRDEIMAFGDGENDETMIKLAKIGVAMKNAEDSLKSIADEITASNEDDGIAKSLYRHFPEVFNNQFNSLR